MAGLIEFSDDVIWYSSAGPYATVLRGAQAYLDDPGAASKLDGALGTNGLILPAIAEPQALHLLRAIDRSAVRLMAELVNSPDAPEWEARREHYAELRAMIRGEVALRGGWGEPEPDPPDPEWED